MDKTKVKFPQKMDIAEIESKMKEIEKRFAEIDQQCCRTWETLAPMIAQVNGGSWFPTTGMGND